MTTSPRILASRILAAAAAVAVATLLAACGSGGTSSGSTTTASSAAPSVVSSPAAVPSSSTSCSVVTQSDVATALGSTVTAGVLGKATVEGGLACVFYGPSAPAGADANVPVPDSVRVVLVTGADGRKWFNDYKSKVPAVALSGLGDQAYYDGSASVSVLKGTSYLRISVIKTTGPDENAEKTLAATAIPRM
jgi:hypothetical protein